MASRTTMSSSWVVACSKSNGLPEVSHSAFKANSWLTCSVIRWSIMLRSSAGGDFWRKFHIASRASLIVVRAQLSRSCCASTSVGPKLE